MPGALLRDGVRWLFSTLSARLLVSEFLAVQSASVSPPSGNRLFWNAICCWGMILAFGIWVGGVLIEKEERRCQIVRPMH